MSIAPRVHTGDVDRLARDLGRVPAEAVPAVYAAVKRGAHNVKTDASERISGLAHAPHYPRSISYDMLPLAAMRGRISAVVGPDARRDLQGGLGNILEYGTSNNPPRPHLAPALDAEGPAFAAAVVAAARQALPG